jgi:hypothetical protein
LLLKTFLAMNATAKPAGQYRIEKPEGVFLAAFLLRDIRDARRLR